MQQVDKPPLFDKRDIKYVASCLSCDATNLFLATRSGLIDTKNSPNLICNDVSLDRWQNLTSYKNKYITQKVS